MTTNFRKKLIIFDVDHTLVDWNKTSTLWTFRKVLAQQGIQSQENILRRGRRSSPIKQQSCSLENTPQLQITHWGQQLILALQKNHWVAICSDLPQPHLRNCFTALHIRHIVDCQEIGALKPLPDGARQLLSTLGVHGSDCFLIGDGVRSDSMMIHRLGGTFIPIEDIALFTFAEIEPWFN